MDPIELQHWCNEFKCTETELKSAIAAVGEHVTAVREHMLGISLLQYIHKQAQTAWPGLSIEQLLHELRQIQQFVLLYPPQGEKGPPRAAVVRSKQTFPQQQLAKTLGLDELGKLSKT